MSLRADFAGIVCDLDGVVYRGPAPVEHAVPALVPSLPTVVFATNNASRPPAAVADHLRGLGLAVDEAQVVTSSQAGARHLAARLAPGACVLAVGGPGVALALTERGLRPLSPHDVRSGGGPVEAVLQGYGAEVTAGDLAEAAYAVEAGALWVATNTDGTLPTDRGVAPGNGTLVAAVARATGVQPDVVGKPQPDLYDLAAERLGTRQLLGVGDRLDTDILGADAAGMSSLWVLTGVHDLRSLATVGGTPRPTWVAVDLRALDASAPEVEEVDGSYRCGGWRLHVADGGGLHAEEGPDAAEGERAAAVLNAGLRLLLSERDAGTAPETLERLAGAVHDLADGAADAGAPEVS